MGRILRTFVGVALPDDMRLALTGAIRRLSSADVKLRCTRPENLHVTLKFLGDTPEEEIVEVCRLVRDAAAGVEPFSAEIAGLGSFPPGGRPRVLWAGARTGAEGLRALYERLEERLRAAGFPAENRRYVPHVTLGRVLGGPCRTLGSIITESREELYGDFQAETLTYYQSELERGGPIYTVLATAPLGQSS
ncbi:MAG: RNA 2',3'-cyclic phosphodiesterase [Planctomycetota bacterium]